jgi:hypothetical protein
MNDLMSKLFSPLDKGACVYFLIITMIFYIMLLLTFLGEIWFAIKNYKQLNFKVVSNGVLLLFNIFIAYFVNRLLYSMCSKSLV